MILLINDQFLRRIFIESKSLVEKDLNLKYNLSKFKIDS